MIGIALYRVRLCVNIDIGELFPRAPVVRRTSPILFAIGRVLARIHKCCQKLTGSYSLYDNIVPTSVRRASVRFQSFVPRTQCSPPPSSMEPQRYCVLTVAFQRRCRNFPPFHSLARMFKCYCSRCFRGSRCVVYEGYRIAPKLHWSRHKARDAYQNRFQADPRGKTSGADKNAEDCPVISCRATRRAERVQPRRRRSDHHCPHSCTANAHMYEHARVELRNIVIKTCTCTLRTRYTHVFVRVHDAIHC